MKGLISYNQSKYTERALLLLEKDVCYYARLSSIPHLTSDEVAQELRIQLWRKIDRYNPSKAGLRAWAAIVMRNYLRDMSRYHHDYLDTTFETIRSYSTDEESYYAASPQTILSGNSSWSIDL